MAASIAAIHLPPNFNAANLTPQAQAELTAIIAQNDWAIDIRPNEPNKHPLAWKQNPPMNAPQPAPEITPTKVVYQLERVYAQARWYFLNTGHFGFLHPVTKEFIGTTFLHFQQLKFLITTVLDHLTKYHLPHGGHQFAPKKVMLPKRELYYLWHKRFQFAYAVHSYSSEELFRRIFNKFLKIVNLPMCAMRIVPCQKGEMSMPAKIVRGPNDPGQDCMNFTCLIDEEWICRLYNVAVPEYMDSLDIEPYEDPDPNSNASYELSHIIVVEKKCVFTRFFNNGFHTENNSVVMSGAGFPDVCSKAYLKYMELLIGSQPQGLCDNNPSGVLLLKSYQHSKDEITPHNMLKTDVGWLGWSPAFGNTFPHVHQHQNYTVTDTRILNHLLNPRNQFVAQQGGYASPARATFRATQLHIMSTRQRKCNLDEVPTQPLLTAVRYVLGQNYQGMF